MHLQHNQSLSNVHPSSATVSIRKRGRPSKNPTSVSSVNLDAVGSLTSVSDDINSCASVPLATIAELDYIADEEASQLEN